MRVLNIIINKFISDKVLKCAYLEKPLNEKFEDIHVHLIFIQDINKNDIFNIIKKLLDDATYITYYVIKDEIYHAVSEDNLSIYFHVDNKNYNYKHKQYLYNPFGIENDEKYIFDKKEIVDLMILHIHEFVNEMHNTYKYYIGEENELSFLCLNKSVKYLFEFLSCYYLMTPDNHSFNDVMDAMEEKRRSELKKDIKAISANNVLESSRMFIWFIDFYINGLPISITKEIDIDYYLYVKKLITGVNK